ncbi:MAG TPA: hypothetical protein VG318_12445 [Actinomycetota bacterium]|nr:hypothetical protein [Actinomycetota bacterium]
MPDRQNHDVAAWIGSAAAVVSAAAAVITALTVNGEDRAPDHLLWAGLAILEALVIAGLVLFGLRRSRIVFPRRTGARNSAIMQSLFKSVSGDFEAQLADLRRARISLFGDRVRWAQIFLMDYCRKAERDMPVVATDIIRDLALWPTRKPYLEANKRFTEDQGRISRIFLVEAALLRRDEDVLALWSVIESHRDIDVGVALHILDLLAPKYHEDFILYSRDCVLVEIQQGDIGFTRGKATIFFDGETIDDYARRFEYLSEANDTRAAADVLRAFQSKLVRTVGGPGTFEERKRSFLDAAQ